MSLQNNDNWGNLGNSVLCREPNVPCFYKVLYKSSKHRSLPTCLCLFSNVDAAGRVENGLCEMNHDSFNTNWRNTQTYMVLFEFLAQMFHGNALQKGTHHILYILCQTWMSCLSISCKSFEILPNEETIFINIIKQCLEWYIAGMSFP